MLVRARPGSNNKTKPQVLPFYRRVQDFFGAIMLVNNLPTQVAKHHAKKEGKPLNENE